MRFSFHSALIALLMLGLLACWHAPLPLSDWHPWLLSLSQWSYPYQTHILSLLTVWFVYTLFFSGKRQSRLLRKMTDFSRLNALTWRQFEVMVGEFYQQKGYKVKVVGGSGGDNGIDLWLKRKGKRYIGQCKHYKTRKIGVSVIREMYGVMHDQQADGVKIITSSDFTRDAYAFAKGKPIELITGKQLIQSIKELRG